MRAHRLAWALGWASLSGCGTLSAVYVQPAYTAAAPDAITHLRVAAWAPAHAEDLAPMMAAVAADLVKLRKNYLVVAAGPGPGALGDPCSPQVQGVLWFRALEVTAPAAGKVGLRAALELYRCRDGALLYRAEGYRATRSQDASLADLVATYKQQLQGRGAAWAAPAFSLAQALVEPLPDPTLSDAQIEEKIELGAIDCLDEGVAATAQLHERSDAVVAAQQLQHAAVVGP